VVSTGGEARRRAGGPVHASVDPGGHRSSMAVLVGFHCGDGRRRGGRTC